MLSELQAAYLAGLIDGEGHIRCQKVRGRKSVVPSYYALLAITMATAEPITTIAGWLDAPIYRYPARGRQLLSVLRTQLTGDRAAAVLESCLPFLVLKRHQAELAIRVQQVRAVGAARRGPRGQLPECVVRELELLEMQLREAKKSA